MFISAKNLLLLPVKGSTKNKGAKMNNRENASKKNGLASAQAKMNHRVVNALAVH